MIVDVVMPKMGESINEGTILEWRKEVGEKINLDEILLEIGTDKVDSEIPSSAAGTVIEILAEPNDVKEVGQVIARIDTDSSEGEVRNEYSPVNEDPLEKKVKIPAPRGAGIFTFFSRGSSFTGLYSFRTSPSLESVSILAIT